MQYPSQKVGCAANHFQLWKIRVQICLKGSAVSAGPLYLLTPLEELWLFLPNRHQIKGPSALTLEMYWHFLHKLFLERLHWSELCLTRSGMLLVLLDVSLMVPPSTRAMRTLNQFLSAWALGSLLGVAERGQKDRYLLLQIKARAQNLPWQQMAALWLSPCPLTA